ncbi:MAG TPA: DUF2269 domain-containing protein [Hyphomicrobiales bacterium]|nr:DUF2269 domain-containing protein [Kaistiaceae bacterium]HQF31684.1 DUF2269 domain-containing protein [Hyphomicrobiales bacterium]
MSYEAYKSVHVLGVVLFLGNIIITGFWKAFADRTGNPVVIAFGQRLVTITDWVFTFGGVVLVVFGYTGMGYGSAHWTFFEHPTWVRWGVVMFYLSGIIWIAVLIPLQIAQARMARSFADGGPIPDRYWRFNRHWFIWGILATILPLANLYFMVFKP